jgi:DNA polymerase-3 subunit delta
MARRRPDSLVVRAAIDEGKIPPVWLWSGPEDFLKEELFARLAARLVPEGLESLNLNRFRAGEDPLDRILTTAATLPMMADRRVVLVRAVEALGRKERETLLAHVAAAGPETALVLATERGPRDSLCTRIAKAGAEARVFWTPFPEETIRWIALRFRDHGKTCEPRVAEALLRTCGGGFQGQVALREVAPEIEKVALHLGDRTAVGEEDLAVVGRRAEEEFLYRIGERVGERDLAGALHALDGALLFRANDPVRIVASLARLLRQVAALQDLRAAGVSPDEARKSLRIWPKEWDTLVAAVRRYPRADLEQGLVRLARVDRTLKSRPDDPRLLLERTLATLCEA